MTIVDRSIGFMKRSGVTSRYALLLEVTLIIYFWFVDNETRQVEWFHEAKRNEIVSRPCTKSSRYASLLEVTAFIYFWMTMITVKSSDFM